MLVFAQTVTNYVIHLPHGPINATQSVSIAHYCLRYRLCCAWQKEKR